MLDWEPLTKRKRGTGDGQMGQLGTTQTGILTMEPWEILSTVHRCITAQNHGLGLTTNVNLSGPISVS